LLTRADILSVAECDRSARSDRRTAPPPTLPENWNRHLQPALGTDAIITWRVNFGGPRMKSLFYIAAIAAVAAGGLKLLGVY
jgi:hypothetical protein